MLIKKIFVKNFRGVKNFEVEINNNMLVIVGQNDVGKSTILHSLRTFFHDRKISTGDFPKYNMEANIEIELYFQTDKFKDVLDNNLLKLKCVYSLDKERDKININKYIYKVPSFPTNEELEQYRTLKKTGKSLGIEFPRKKPKSDEEIKKLRKRVMEVLEEKRGEYQWVDASDDWSNYKKHFPEIVYIPASQDHGDEQRMTKDSSVFGQIFRVGMRKWLKVDKKSQNAIGTLEEKIKDINSKILHKVEEKLREQIPLADEVSQELKPLDITKGFDFTMYIDDPQGIKTPLDQRGSGLQRAVLIAAIRAQSDVYDMIDNLEDNNQDSVDENSNTTLYLFEEPEAFLHLGAQRELFYSLKDLTKRENQIVVTSHSTLFIDESEMEDIVLMTRKEGESISSQHIPEIEIKDELGEVMRVSELITGKACCIVEGVSDKLAFQNWIENIGYDYGKLGIHFVSMDGCTNAEYYANADILSDFYVPFLLVLDRDTHMTRDPKKIKRRLEEKYSFLRNNNRIRILDGELENYFSLDKVSDALNIPEEYIDKEEYDKDPKKALEIAKDKAIEEGLKGVRAYNERKHGRKIAAMMEEDEITEHEKITDIIETLVDLAEK
mgnify:CR=1 FL=1